MNRTKIVHFKNTFFINGLFDNLEPSDSMVSGWSPEAVASVSQNPTETLYTATGVLGFFYRKISAIKHCRAVMGQPSKSVFIYFLRVSAGDQPLAKEPKDSGYEIRQCKKNVSPIY